MSDAANRIVQKLWSYCNVLRDDGLSYQDYKMADERAQLTGEPQPIPEGHRWADLAAPQMEGAPGDQALVASGRVILPPGYSRAPRAEWCADSPRGPRPNGSRLQCRQPCRSGPISCRSGRGVGCRP